jgi:predicted lipoprotein with Yx(FWY)xxD motif
MTAANAHYSARCLKGASTMKRFALAVICCALATSALAAPKSCEKLKAKIEATIQAKGVTSYTLEIVTNDEVHDKNMIVGSCEGGTKKIIYQKNDR